MFNIKKLFSFIYVSLAIFNINYYFKYKLY
jgi:hypothetical protein